MVKDSLDFGELRKIGISGQCFEELIRNLGVKQFNCVGWTGAGPDGGKDLIFSDSVIGNQTKWLVSCKHTTGNVSESDLPANISNKLLQNGCDGFLLATSSGLTVGAKNMIDGFDGQDIGLSKICTAIWDRAKLIELLTKPENRDLLLTYFPKTGRELASFDQLESTNLLEIVKAIAGDKPQLAFELVSELIRHFNGKPIAIALTDYALGFMELSYCEVYGLLYDVATQTKLSIGCVYQINDLIFQKSGENGFDEALASEFDDNVLLSEAYLENISIWRTQDDLHFEGQVSISTNIGMSGIGSVSGLIEENDLNLSDISIDSNTFLQADELDQPFVP
ncbi:MAG: restriction endonuclease [Candidatus Obscuribacter sp.]|nr:restriction endonuclease [Candidatus Obscuribacter sp.]